MSDPDPKRIVAAGYDRIAGRYLAWTEEEVARTRIRYTLVLLSELAEGAEVLELGCGAAGPTTQALARRFHLTGVDISAQQIALAQKRLPQARFIQADMTQLELPPGSLDGVAAFYCLFHLPRTEQALMFRKIASWLRPGGLLVANLGIHNNEGETSDFLGVPMYYSSYTPKISRSLVQRAGLRIVRTELEMAEEFGAPVSFFWVVARKGEHEGRKGDTK